jgi:cytochrome c551/c552
MVRRLFYFQEPSMKKLIVIGCLVFIGIVLLSGKSLSLQSASGAESVASQRALVDQYCVSCHNEKRKTAGIAMDKLDIARVSDNPEVWEKIVHKVRAGMQPPSGSPRPDRATLEAFVVWVENELDRNAVLHFPSPGLHRVNRAEYTNVIRDLLGLEIDAAKFLPPDDSTRGFDNIAAALGLSPALLEAYLSAAGKISRLAIGDVRTSTQTLYRVREDVTQNSHIEGLPFGTRGGILVRHEFPADGEYAIKVVPVNRGLMGGAQAFGDVKGERLEILLDGERLGIFDWDTAVTPPRGGGQPGTVDIRFTTRAGLHSVGVTFLATQYAPLLDIDNPFERSTIETGGLPGFTFFPHVGSVRIDGPNNSSGAADTLSRKRIFVCRPSPSTQTTCAQKIVSTLAGRAFRQSASPDDLKELMTLYQSGRKEGNFDHGIEMALQGILAHPKFIYRFESEDGNVPADQPYRISDLELASRLSFFLWSTSPDDELRRLADQKKLSDPATLERQVRRMLEDPRSEALVVNFAGQWLKLRSLDASYPAVPLFPDFDDNLRQAFRREVELFFGSVVQEDRNVVDLLTADYTYLNERLARHYGIPNIYGSQFRRVTLGAEFDVRRGLLGKGAIQTVSALPTRTSLVGRGKWILQNIVGTQPPDPPPFAVPPLSGTGEGGKVLSLRQQMEMHRRVEPCASCHKIMDPIGIAMENFDAIGKWRTDDEGIPIDASGVLVDGTKMNGVVDLREALLHYSPQFVRNVTERLMTYAMGRGVEYYDMPMIRSIVKNAGKNNYRFSSIVLGIVKSPQFQTNMKLTDSKTREVAGRD